MLCRWAKIFDVPKDLSVLIFRVNQSSLEVQLKRRILLAQWHTFTSQKTRDYPISAVEVI